MRSVLAGMAVSSRLFAGRLVRYRRGCEGSVEWTRASGPGSNLKRGSFFARGGAEPRSRSMLRNASYRLHGGCASFDRLRMRENLGGTKKALILSLSKDAQRGSQPR